MLLILITHPIKLNLINFLIRHPIKVDKHKTIEAMGKTDPNQIAQIYDLLEIIHTLFEKEGIWYSLEAGSLLGAVRHNGVIPWDDDGNAIILHKDTKNI